MHEDDLEPKRRRMLDLDLAARGITDANVLAAFASVPREAFVPRELADEAYADRPLPIGEGQTISQPYIVARTIDALELRGGERVLEIGTGSGYAAAVLGRVAREVDTVERIASLATVAAERLERLGASNVHVHHGDGTLGWPEHGPYDAIAVAAGGPVVPQALLDQLAVGGRLVMPVVSQTGTGQTLVRVRRTTVDTLEREELEDVQFVPLIGTQGFDVDPERRPTILFGPRMAKPGTAPSAARIVREAAEPLDDLDHGRIDGLLERLASARIVLLGESTHGTSEFYRMRARITRELVTRFGFDFVAAEADWPDAARLDAFVRGARAPVSRFDFAPFSRFPTWMWRNEEVRAFAEWLHAYNDATRGRGRGVGFHGLDLYSMYTSIGIVLRYLDETDPEAARRARKRYARLMPWEDAPEGYGLAVTAGRIDPAEEAVLATLRDLLARRLEYVAHDDGGRFFDAAQNARVVAAAERYYRAMYRGSAESWNLRDSHMFETLRLLLAYYGPASKGIVWAHNSHVGDARATEMIDRNEVDLGQLCRQAFAADARLVGFSTHRGLVTAATDWGEDGRVMRVRPGHPESYEHVLHDAGVPAFVLALREPARAAVVEELSAARLFRAIGVVYVPETELESHYLVASLPRHFDELVWFDETSAVRPLPAAEAAAPAPPDLPETYPFAV